MAFRRPPQALQRTSEVVCTVINLHSTQEESFRNLHRYLMTGNMTEKIESIASIQPGEVNSDAIDALKSYYEDESCSPDTLKRVSIAGGAFCVWLRAMHLSA
jgi:hypothetical protein